ncbi:hypothetical protein [Rubinisphaera sp.]|uniref:hypothetical protein n=1 Tax=Rubinisphaera sp. TaxID=2024857 RepID=UPI000C0D74D8|nr:hypothetical protein [Rubinisphaera sp.]MBV08381.1 hypothetical protein [Rubinisphaera sp.]HCS55592.1 hypothetical protein [Planctomycetaceae bacterium]|tara:strand:- start:2106 stop:2741 length:636 start_codon:yes stop_codon:yes gene_type:complete
MLNSRLLTIAVAGSCLLLSTNLNAQVLVPTDEDSPAVAPATQGNAPPATNNNAPPASSTTLVPGNNGYDETAPPPAAEAGGLFEAPEGLSLDPMCLFCCVGYRPPVAYTYDQSMLLSLACYRAGYISDALVLAKHAQTFREDAGNLYVIAYCQLALGQTSEAEATIGNMVSALQNGYPGGIANYKERLNGPIGIAINAVEKHLFLSLSRNN